MKRHLSHWVIYSDSDTVLSTLLFAGGLLAHSNQAVY